MKISQAARIGRHLLNARNLTLWSVKFEIDLPHCAETDFDSHEVILDPLYVLFHDDLFTVDSIKHEIAHIESGEREHNVNWMWSAIRVGAVPTLDGRSPEWSLLPYRARCNKCGFLHSRHVFQLYDCCGELLTWKIHEDHMKLEDWKDFKVELKKRLGYNVKYKATPPLSEVKG